MKVKDLIDTVYAKTIKVVEDRGGIFTIGPNGWGYQYTIQRAAIKFGEREVLGVYDMGKCETVIHIA